MKCCFRTRIGHTPSKSKFSCYFYWKLITVCSSRSVRPSCCSISLRNKLCCFFTFTRCIWWNFYFQGCCSVAKSMKLRTASWGTTFIVFLSARLGYFLFWNELTLVIDYLRHVTTTNNPLIEELKIQLLLKEDAEGKLSRSLVISSSRLGICYHGEAGNLHRSKCRL